VPEEDVRLGIPCRKWGGENELEVKVFGW